MAHNAPTHCSSRRRAGLRPPLLAAAAAAAAAVAGCPGESREKVTQAQSITHSLTQSPISAITTNYQADKARGARGAAGQRRGPKLAAAAQAQRPLAHRPSRRLLWRNAMSRGLVQVTPHLTRPAPYALRQGPGTAYQTTNPISTDGNIMLLWTALYFEPISISTGTH